MVSDRFVILLTGIGTIAAATALAMTGHESTAAIVVPAGLGIINIFLRTNQRETSISLSSQQQDSTIPNRDAAAPRMEIRSDDTGVIRTATQQFMSVSQSQQNLPAMQQTDSGKVIPK